MLFLFSQNIKKQVIPAIGVSSRFFFFAVRCLSLGLLTLSASLMRIVVIARVYISPSAFFAYRCITTNNSYVGVVDKHKSEIITLYSNRPATRVFFTPHRFLTILFSFMRLFFMSGTNNNSRLSPHVFCFFYHTLTRFRSWL